MIELQIPGLSPGLKMQVHESGDQMISARLKIDHCWEAYETALTLQHLKAGEVYVDVGANIGYYTLVAAQKVGTRGKVIAYEPDPDNFALLQANVTLNKLSQVEIFPYALYDKDTDGQLFLSGDNFGDHRIYSASKKRETRSIKLVQGDEHVGGKTERVDFLKIDTQGSEFYVVKGLEQVITKNRDHLRIMLEFCPFGIRQSGADGHELLQLLDNMKFQYHIVDHQQECLIPAQSHHLRDWITQMSDEPHNEGFVNLLLMPNS